MVDNYTVTVVTRVTSIGDLGIIINFNMDFSIRINNFIEKALKALSEARLMLIILKR